MNQAERRQAAASRFTNPIRSIASAWLLAATIDITVASIYYPFAYKMSLMQLYQGIASGVLGAKAFSYGIGSAALGLLCHYLIALIWTVIFFFIYPGIKILSRSKLIIGVLYGVFVSCMMSFAVLPLSNDPNGHHPVRFLPFVIATIILMFSIGTPISMIIGNYYSRKQGSANEYGVEEQL